VSTTVADQDAVNAAQAVGIASIAPTAVPLKGPRVRRMKPSALFGTPIVLILMLGATYIYVHSQKLDSIEKRTLNEPYLRTALGQHMKVALYATFFILLISIPLGVVLSRRWARFGAPVVLIIANVGQAAPVVGVLTLLVLGTHDVGVPIALIAFVPYGILPILRNTIVGLQQIDKNLIEAARGIGMNPRQVLFKIELPLSVPVLLAGVRTTLTLTVAVTVLATFVDAGGLGDIIVNGLKLNRTPVEITGAVLAVSIALFIDWVARLIEDVLRPRGL
jgi:osmoprotectant transport system permease protein